MMKLRSLQLTIQLAPADIHPQSNNTNINHGNPKPSFLGVITHILGVQNLHFSLFWGPREPSPNMKVTLSFEHFWHLGVLCLALFLVVPTMKSSQKNSKSCIGRFAVEILLTATSLTWLPPRCSFIQGEHLGKLADFKPRF